MLAYPAGCMKRVDRVDCNLGQRNLKIAWKLATPSMDEVSPHKLLRKLKLYQTKAKFYLVGSTGDKQHFRICKFSRLEVRRNPAAAGTSLPFDPIE